MAALFMGHSVELRVASVLRMTKATLKALKATRPLSWSGGWTTCLKHKLATFGWKVAGKWLWRHARQDWDLDWRALADNPHEVAMNDMVAKTLHLVRESWREFCFTKWKLSGRRDAAGCEDLVYDEYRCKAVRSLWDKPHLAAVVSGAVVSNARFAVMKGLPVPLCVDCGGDVDGWDHCAWECPGSRPLAAGPVDILQRRLGWPATCGGVPVHDHVVALDKLAVKRCEMLGRRHGRPDIEEDFV
jgi:hypothetical protein